MKIDRKKIVNRCGYDQNECMLLAKRLSECPDATLIPELKKISVWNYGKCELGLWADVLDRLDAILERAVAKVGKWMLRLDTPEEASLVDDVVTILEFTGHLIEHSIYRYLYGSWNHILALFGSENMDILLAVLGLLYNFSKRSNYFIRLEPYTQVMVRDRLVSIAETWGGAENNFGLAACCNPDHFPETAGNIYFEYRPNKPDQLVEVDSIQTTNASVTEPALDGRGRSGGLPWSTSHKIVLHSLHKRNQSPSHIMEELLAQHPVPVSKQMALFARVRLATYFADPEQRHKCIRARLQALSILSYTSDVDERHLYPNLLDELVEVLELPDGHYMGIKACALRTMTAIVNSHRLGVDWTSLVGSTGLSNYHGILPNLTRRWIHGLVDGTVEAPGGSTNQQFTTALLSFLYHLACYEENAGSGNTQSATLNNSGVLDTMLQLISWHNSRNDCLSYVTRAVRVTDQILMSVSSSRQHVVTILVNRLSYEVDLVLKNSKDSKISYDHGPVLNTQRSGLMKSMLSLLKRLCLDTEWSDVMQAAMDGDLPNILRRIFLNGQTHFTPHLALFAMEAITNYLYTYPSRISAMQDKHVTTDILRALTDQPLPQNRDFLVQLPGLFNTLALNSRGIEAIQSSGVLSQYLNTLVSPDYLPTMKTKRVRDFLSQISFNPTSSSSQTLSNSLTASQMSNAIQELLRSHNELKPTVFQGLVACFKRVVELGNMQPATLFPESAFSATGFPDISDQDKIHNFSPRSTEMQSRSSGSGGSHTLAAGDGTQTHSGTNLVSGPIEDRGGAMLDDDVVMLSGGEDEDDDDENDIDDVTRATQTVERHSFQNIGTRLLDSRSVSPTISLGLKEATTSGTRMTPMFDGTPVPPQLFLSDFLLNTCKFLEKLFPSVMHVTEAMCRHFVSHGGLEVLCDLLRMPGLPYDFPASPVCTSLCKIFEDLANFINLNNVIDPLFQCLEASVMKMAALYDSQFKGTSILLAEYMAHEHSYAHELVVTASIICIMVQMIDHVKPELRPQLANKWISRSLLPTLGRLYLGVSWEAGILLTLLSGDNDITEEDIRLWRKHKTDFESSRFGPGKTIEGDSKQTVNAIPIPQFVEVLHIYALLKPSKNSEAQHDQSILRRYPELVKAACRILHLATFLLNSMTELFTAWGRFFASRNQMNHRRRRINLITSDQIPIFTKCVALSQVSQVLTGLLSWEVPNSVSKNEVPPKLVCAMRYAAIRMTNLLLHDSGQKGPQGSMLHAFFFQGGVQRYFGLFRELLDLDLDDSELHEPLTVVLEEWLACACRIGNTDSLVAELRRIADTDGSAVDVEEYVESIHQSMLFPLEQLCVRSDLQNLLTRGAVEHFVNMLVGIVPYIFNRTKISQDKVENSSVVEHAISRSDVVSEPAVSSDLPDAEATSSVSNLTHEAGDATAVDLTRALSPRVGAPVQLGDDTTQLADVQGMNQSDSLTGQTGISTATPMETENSHSRSEQVRDPATLQLMQEMGFSRELCLVALEQTDWNANEAVNLVIATPSEDLLSATMNSPSMTRNVLPTSARISDPPEPLDGGAEASEWSAASVSTDTPDRPTSSLNLAATVAQCIEEALFVNRGSHQSIHAPALPQVANSSSQGGSPSKAVTGYPSSSFQFKMLSPEQISTLRESLKQNAFRACYAVAKLHQSDQILHRIAELLLSTGEEERYIDQLFGMVATNMSSRLGITTTHSALKCDSVLVEPVSEHPIVGLHLAALLFTRCQSLCARLAWQYDLPRLLVSWVSRVDWAPNYQHESNLIEPMDTETSNVMGTSNNADSPRDTTKNYFQTMLLAMLILDQYERSVQAMELRKSSVGLYLNSHSWFWFDERAILWHPYTIENTLAIDIPFHKGELYAYCHISRRPYCVEFPTMTQMNLDSMHRRPVLVLPSLNKSDSPPTEYERSILDTQIPPSLTAEQRRVLYTAIIQHFESVSKITDSSNELSNGRVLTLIPSKCVNAMLRLLLRLAYSDYNDANSMMDLNVVNALLNLPHGREFTGEYSTFVATLLMELFGDQTTVNSVMRDVLQKMSEFGVPNGYMGINPNQTGCRDLFYLMGMCAPLFAKDRKTALKLVLEVMTLPLSDSDVQAKTVPKTYLVEPVSKNCKSSVASISLSERQKGILTLLIDLVVRSPNSVLSRKQKLAQESPCSYTEETELQRDNDKCNNQTTGAQNLFTCISHSSSTSANWTSGPIEGNVSSAPSDPQQLTPVTSSASTFVNNPTKSSPRTNNIAFLGKGDALRHLINFVISYGAVAEFVALYKLPPSEPVCDSTERCTFLSHLFTYQLNHPETTELTATLLADLVLMSSESTQATIISEFKLSLGRIAAPGYLISLLKEKAITSKDPMKSLKNACLAAHMLFLERILSLPTPLVNKLIRIIYKRHIPSDVAKLIANVDYNFSNTQLTLSIIVRTLESLTWVERQISKLPNVQQAHTSSTTLSQNGTNTAPSGLDAQSQLTRNSNSADRGIGLLDSRPTRSSEAQQPTEDNLISRSYETDSDDDDDEDDHDARGQQQQNQENSTTDGSDSITSRGDHSRAVVTSSGTATLNIVLEDVLIGNQGSGNLIRPESGHQTSESRSSWHHSVGAGGQDDSIIFVHDDEEDEGQGGEGENSQEDDVMEDEDEEEDDDDEDEEDEDEDVEDEEAEGDEDENRDDEHDDDISGDDEEVAFVLRGGPQSSTGGGGSGGRINSGSRRPRRHTDASMPISGGRVPADLEPLENETDEVDQQDREDEEADVVLRDDEVDEDDGSFEDDVVDTFARDDDDDLRLPDSNLTSHIFFSRSGQIVRGGNPVVAMVEEMFNLVDVPAATVTHRHSGSRRDRLSFSGSDASDNGLMQSGSSLGNWGLVLPGMGPVDGVPLRGPPPPPVFGIAPTASFRFGLGSGAGSGTPIFLTSGNSNRITQSGLNFLPPGNRIEGVGPSYVSLRLPPPILANQHPLLQVPSVPSRPTPQTTASLCGHATVPSNNTRPNRTIITNTSSTQPSNRTASTLPPTVPQLASTLVSSNFGLRNRVPGNSSVPIVIGNSGIRQRGLQTRLYGNADNSGGHAHTSAQDHAGSTPAASTTVFNVVRDNRTGPEADTLVWNMLTNLAEDQPMSMDSALANAIFSHLPTNEGGPLGRGASQVNGLASAQLSSFAGCALPGSYRQWIELSCMLFGHELMDLMLISRHNVYIELAARRQNILAERVRELEEQAIQEETSKNENSNVQDVASEDPVPLVVAQDTSEDSTSTDIVSSLPVSTTHAAENNATEAQSTHTEPHAAPVSGTDSSTTPSATAATSNVLRPLTDEETIQSLVEGGMDPSFLDALPEDMRTEVIADHRHARQVQQRLSSITLPEHINSDWLAGLPPHIQEEVLNQFRQEQQQSTSGTGDTTQRSPENNTAFLLSLPTALRREVLADMEESQFDMLPPELAAEARQLRREHEERLARNVQNGVLTQSFNSRAEQNLWRNITATAGLIGGSGRWDVRFRSPNQFLRYLRNTLNAASGSNALLGLHNIPAGRGRHLVDYEGLTCLIVLLVGSSSCSLQRRLIIPTLKKVLRNLSYHYGTRNWIVGSLLSLFDSLSEKLPVSHRLAELQCESSDALLPPGPTQSTSNVTKVEQNDLALNLLPSPSTNNIFTIGFEAALGCWIRVFHPLTHAEEISVDSRRPQTSTCSSPRRHIIHPQAAVSVAGVLLDTLSELARTFPSYFYPRPADSKHVGSSATLGDVRSNGLDQLRPSFWDVFDRLSQSPPDISSTHFGIGRASRRVHGSSRKRQGSVSTKPIAIDPPNTSLPMDISYSSHGSATASEKPETTESATPAYRRLSFHSSSVNVQLHCFEHLCDLLCHPLLQDRPVHQERLLSILAGIVKEFVVVRGQSMHSVANPNRLANVTDVSGVTRHATESQVSTSVDGSQRIPEPTVEPTTSMTSTENTLDLINPIRLEVITFLCGCVLAPRSTDVSRTMAAQLITDMAKFNRITKENILLLLWGSSGRLAAEISLELQDLIDEIDSSKPDRTSRIPEPQISDLPSSSVDSTSTRLTRTSFDVLPDRFSASGQVVVIAGDSRPTQPPNAFINLQLKSIQTFSAPNCNQMKLRSILGLLLRITCGDSSVSVNGSIPMCAHDPFQSVSALPELWSRLSVAFEKLSSLPEQSAVLLLHPLLEAFCLAHLYLVKDSVMLRQRSAISRSARVNPSTSGNSSLNDMVPVLQLRVEPPSAPSLTRGDQGDTATNENTTHLHMDVAGPMSPLYVPIEDERSAGDVGHCALASVSSASNSNIILQFAEQHRNAINQTLRYYGGGLGESPLSVFLVYPRVLDFDIKRRFFRQQLQALNGRTSVTRRYDDEPVVISRDRIFEDSYARLHQKSPQRWKHKFVIRFQHEEGQDAGGPLREWYLLMSREIFNPNYCLFRTSPADRVTYSINPSSYINSNHLSYFKFVGRFIAKAIYDNKLLECYFSRSFYKHILGVPLKFSDLESDDYDFYKGLEFLLKNHVSDLGYELTFSTEINEFGKTETRDLIENGRNVPVTEQNKREYVRLVCQERMTGAIRQQLAAFLGGFYEIIPKRLISVFNEQELELLISGLPNIDIADLRAHTTYSKYQPNSPQIEWFWRALESFDQEDRARFLQFVTGTSKVPLGGFANLEGIHGPTQFQISRATGASINHLPSAHTCFNTLILPAYETYEHLRARLLTAIRECSEGYGMA